MGAFIVDTARLNQITEKVLSNHCKIVRNAWIGRSLYRLLKQAGLSDVLVKPFTLVFNRFALANKGLIFNRVAKYTVELGEISEKEKHAWISHLIDLNQRNTFFVALLFSLPVE